MSLYLGSTTAPKKISHLVAIEDQNLSRSTSEMAINESFNIGTPLAKDGTGLLVALDPAAPAPMNELIGFSTQFIETDSATTKSAQYIEALAVLKDSGIEYPSTITVAQKAALKEQARLFHIKIV